MMIHTLLCKTKCYLIQASEGYLLFDAGWPGQYRLFKDTAKAAGIRMKDVIAFVVSHFHMDHAGLAGIFVANGIRFVVFENQQNQIDEMEGLIGRKGYPYTPIDKSRMDIMRLQDSRAWLNSINISGEIVQTFSHGKENNVLLLDSGEAFIGDLPPLEEYSELARSDWARLRSMHVRHIFPAHAKEFELTPTRFD
jgi:glyoxylase-like metal-dependent hydrolase (beta-lactamase superfamily II)